MSRLHALIPAAGTGSRSGQPLPKQYAVLAGQPVLAHTLDALRAVAALDRILVVVAPDDAHFDALFPGQLHARCGGATRGATVQAGLQALRELGAAPQDWVLVHDAARCLLQPAWVEALVKACYDHPVGGLLACPVADTVKRAGPDTSVEATLSREGLWLAQTPQMFRIDLLARALREAGPAVTDEASAVEQLGLRPRLVPAPLENFKVTLPADFLLADTVLRSRS